MHLCKVCLVKTLKIISRKILKNGGKFVNLPHCADLQHLRSISRKNLGLNEEWIKLLPKTLLCTDPLAVFENYGHEVTVINSYTFFDRYFMKATFY